jgi:DNA-binding MurR/RpiR family transcriptional regulator
LNRVNLKKKIIEAFSTMPAQLQSAARYVLDNPQDAALLTMREQARHAGVQPATMIRLAKHLGFDGYEEMRGIYADALRTGDIGFSAKAGPQFSDQRLKGHKALAADLIEVTSNQIAALSAPESLARLDALAKKLTEARRVFCLGLRSSHAIAWHFHYIISLCGANSTYLESAGGTGADALASAAPTDVLFAVSVSPYTRATIDLAEYAASRNIPILAITDSEVAPLASLAELAIIVSTDTPSFFHTMSPAFVAAEILGALIAGRRGERALDALRNAEDQFSALQIHLRPNNSRKPS